MIIVSINTTNIPYVFSEDRFELEQLCKHIYSLKIHIGFMQLINIPVTLSHAKKRDLFPFEFDLKTVTYMVEITHISATERKMPSHSFGKKNFLLF